MGVWSVWGSCDCCGSHVLSWIEVVDGEAAVGESLREGQGIYWMEGREYWQPSRMRKSMFEDSTMWRVLTLPGFKSWLHPPCP